MSALLRLAILIALLTQRGNIASISTSIYALIQKYNIYCLWYTLEIILSLDGSINLRNTTYN